MADIELEALVGHLFVVGGRSIKAASPGSVAMAAPRRAARGRDEDSFFGLISLRDDQRQPASFYEQIIQELSERYFSTGGSVTSALRDSITQVNTDLFRRQPEGARMEVGLACAILRQSEIYIAVVGPARCFLLSEDEVVRLPDNEDLTEGMTALGAYTEAEIRFFHHRVSPGDFMLLSDSALNRLTDTTLRHAISDGSVDLALNNLAGVAGEFAAAELIQFVLPEDAPAEPAGAHPPAAPAARKPALPAFPIAPPAIFGTRRREAPPPVPPAEAATEHPPVLPPETVGEQSTEPAIESREPDLPASAPDGEAMVRRPRLGQAEGISEEQPFYLSSTMQLGVAVAVAVLVALITTAVYRTRGQSSEYAQLVREAQAEIELAREAGGNQAQARAHWETAVFMLDEAARIRAPGEIEGELRAEALSALDAYDHVTRIDLILLREYEPGAVLRGPIIQDLDLYLIDTTGDILYREDLSQDATSLVNPESRIITRQGELVNDQVIGGLIDLVWMENGGVPQQDVLAAIARNGLLVTYSPSLDVTSVVLPGFEAWREPRAMAVYGRDLYILDAGANQIWRYEAGTDSYPTTPQVYFTDITPALSDAIDMAIDSNGNVFVLHADGRISKYFLGKEEVFVFEDTPQPLTRPAALHLSFTTADRSLYIADPGGGRLFRMAPTGAFLYNYKDAGDTTFDALSGVFNMDTPPYVYVTAGSRLYYFARP